MRGGSGPGLDFSRESIFVEVQVLFFIGLKLLFLHFWQDRCPHSIALLPDISIWAKFGFICWAVSKFADFQSFLIILGGSILAEFPRTDFR